MPRELKTGIVIRGLKNQNRRPFKDTDFENDRLDDASVNCIEGSKEIIEVMEGMPIDMYKYGYRKTTVEKIRQKVSLKGCVSVYVFSVHFCC